VDSIVIGRGPDDRGVIVSAGSDLFNDGGTARIWTGGPHHIAFCRAGIDQSSDRFRTTIFVREHGLGISLGHVGMDQDLE
jgi:hypothetical protein